MQPQTNSIIRALTLLEILKKRSDADHKLSQQQLLELMKKKDGSCTEKTLRSDVHNLMGILNPSVEEYEDRKDEFRIVYDGIEEGRERISGLRYMHVFSNRDLELLLELVQTCTDIGEEERQHIIRGIKDLGSEFYTYNADTIKGIPEYSTINSDNLRLNIWTLGAAIKQNCQVSFVINKYNRDGKLIPAKESRYEVNPYHIVKYGVKYYLLASHGELDKTYIYRLDLMTEIEFTEKKRVSIREIKELNNSSAMEYMERHLHMNYDEPRTVTIKLDNNHYTQFHDSFGNNYKVKRTIDEKYDEVEVLCSENAIVNWAIQNNDYVEIIRPNSVKKKIIEKAEALLKKYQ